MGLMRALTPAARRLGGFVSGAGNALDDRLGPMSKETGMAFMPVTSALTGAGMGAMVGGAGGPEGAGMGAMIGGGLMGGRSLARIAGTALVNGVREMMQMTPIRGPGFEAAKRELAEQLMQHAGNPDMPLFAGVARQDGQRAAQMIMGARDGDELIRVAEQIEGSAGPMARRGAVQFY